MSSFGDYQDTLINHQTTQISHHTTNHSKLEDIKTNMKENRNTTTEIQQITRAPLVTTKAALKRR